MIEKIKAKGTLIIKKNGKVIKEVTNLIVNGGLETWTGLLLTDTTGSYTAFDFMAIGIGTTTQTATDTTLETESLRVAGTGTQITTSTTNDTAQLVATFNITSTLAITESGIFNDATTGTMFNRTTFPAENVINGDDLELTWKIQLGNS